MHEFSSPATIDVPPTAALSDAVTANALARPEAVVFSRKAAGSWTPVTSQEFAAEVAGMARGLVAAGVQAGDRVGIMQQDPLRVDARRLRDLDRGRRGGPDLRDVLGGAGRSGSSPTPARSPSSSRRRRTRRSSSSVRDRLPDLRHVWQIDAGGSRRPRRAGHGRRRAGAGRPPRDARGRLARHDHLHVGHDRTAEGLRAHPRQPAVRRRPGAHAHPGLRGRRRELTLLFLPLAHVFARLIQVGCVAERRPARATPPTSGEPAAATSAPSSRPSSCRAAGLREGLQRRPAEGARRRQGRDLRPRRARRRRLVRGARTPAAPASASTCSTSCSTGWSTPSCAPPWAARSRTRCPAAPRSASGSATSSAASASRSSRATASPRPPARAPAAARTR